MGRILKTIRICTRAGEVISGEIEIRSTLKDMRLMAVDAIFWEGENGRFLTNTGRGLSIRNAEEETGTTWNRAGQRKNILVDLDPIVPSGQDDMICRICSQGVEDGVFCPLKQGTVHYQHCFQCKHGHWTGDYQSCRYRYKKGPALW